MLVYSPHRITKKFFKIFFHFFVTPGGFLKGRKAKKKKKGATSNYDILSKVLEIDKSITVASTHLRQLFEL